jgi:DNA helicase IV
MRSPETSVNYPSHKVIVFVQDSRTKDYFSHLLPDLGINYVEITTFSEWALRMLNLEDYVYTSRYGESEEQRDKYEYEKVKALRSRDSASSSGSKNKELKYSASPQSNLKKVYEKSFITKEAKELFTKQIKEKLLDRFDLAILLDTYLKSRKSNAFSKNGKKISYSAILVDEFQNHLPEHISILERTLDPMTNSIIYMGDMAQQINIGTSATPKEFGEKISQARSIVLQHVYRNTSNIMKFIANAGYDVNIKKEGSNLREGEPVEEILGLSPEEVIIQIKAVIEKNKKDNTEVAYGILAKEKSYLSKFKAAFSDQDNVHILSMSESQGVEFDTVFIVGLDKSNYDFSHVPTEHLAEKIKIEKDLLYIALTRAMNKMYVFGSSKVSEILSLW